MRPGARDLLTSLLDVGSFVSWDEPPVPPVTATPDYLAQLERAARASGVDESVLTGHGTVDGAPVAVVVSEFGFLAGTVGVATAVRIETAVRRATEEGLPLLAAPASGGTRMQEGTAAFVEMIGITAAIVAHRAAGLPYLVYLRHPTMGGVFASWGSLGHVTIAEPGALLGFLGPKVYEAMRGVPFEEGVQTAEHLARNGIVDAVVPLDALRDVVGRTLRIITGTPHASGEVPSAQPETDAWQAVSRSRAADRPGVRDVLRHAATGSVTLAGGGGVVTALAELGGVPCVVIGQDRDGELGPADLRRARHAIRIAAQLRLPLVTFIDTPGASLSRQAEEQGLSAEIAGCMADLIAVGTPTVAVLLGEGAGGGALALLPADRVVAVADAWLSPLPPEGASAILHRGDTSHAAELARAQGIAAGALAARGIVDVLVPAPDDPAKFAAGLAAAIARELDRAGAVDPADRGAIRARRGHPH